MGFHLNSCKCNTYSRFGLDVHQNYPCSLGGSHNDRHLDNTDLLMHIHEDSLGILQFGLPNEEVKTCEHGKIAKNFM